MTDRERKPDDILTARDLVAQYGLAPRVAESIVRSLLRQGKGVPSPIRRRLVRRADVFPEAQSSGGTTPYPPQPDHRPPRARPRTTAEEPGRPAAQPHPPPQTHE